MPSQTEQMGGGGGKESAYFMLPTVWGGKVIQQNETHFEVFYILLTFGLQFDTRIPALATRAK